MCLEMWCRWWRENEQEGFIESRRENRSCCVRARLPVVDITSSLKSDRWPWNWRTNESLYRLPLEHCIIHHDSSSTQKTYFNDVIQLASISPLLACFFSSSMKTLFSHLQRLCRSLLVLFTSIKRENNFSSPFLAWLVVIRGRLQSSLSLTRFILVTSLFFFPPHHVLLARCVVILLPTTSTTRFDKRESTTTTASSKRRKWTSI